jgi:hypothetical protein
VTRRAEQRIRETGKLNELVDPAGYGVIRQSLARFELLPSGQYALTVGTPIPLEARSDTTGSMGHLVDVVMKVLPSTHALTSQVLPGYDPQYSLGIFGDVEDRFPLQRPQFEMLAEKIVESLTLMGPERGGGDFPEDPHYGIFGAAYLTDAYINRIGLKGYDFTISDAPARDRLSERELRRIFGKDVFEKVAANGFQMNPKRLPTTKEVVADLQKRAHAFFLQVGGGYRDYGYGAQETSSFWTDVFGPAHVVVLPSVELMPHVQAVIIGLTEGTLELQQVGNFLKRNGVSKTDAAKITRSVANIPIGAQANLPNFDRRPKKGDVFATKTDVWPLDPKDVIPMEETLTGDSSDGPDWL